MSVEALARTLKAAIDAANATNGRAQQGIWNDGIITSGGVSYTAVQAVPCNLYNGKKVWFQISDAGIAVVIGD